VYLRYRWVLRGTVGKANYCGRVEGRPSVRTCHVTGNGAPSVNAFAILQTNSKVMQITKLRRSIALKHE